MEGKARPKSSLVAWLFTHYAEDLEYDLLQRGVDLLDWYRGTLSTRRVALLFERLPATSATLTAIVAERSGVQPAELRSWGPTELLLAKVIDAIQIGTHANVQMNTKKKLQPPAPITVPGSHIEKPKPRRVSLTEVRKLMEG